MGAKFKVTFEIDEAKLRGNLLTQFDARMEDTRRLVEQYGARIMGDVQRLTPVDTGDLKASWRLKVTETGLVITATVSTDVEYAIHVEFGTRPHVIAVKNASVLTNGVQFFGQQVNHPGTKAQPHLRPGFDLHRDNFIRDLRKIWGS